VHADDVRREQRQPVGQRGAHAVGEHVERRPRLVTRARRVDEIELGGRRAARVGEACRCRALRTEELDLAVDVREVLQGHRPPVLTPLALH
jgi:hypothetical protein